MTLDDQIKLAEGFRSKPYDDATGKELQPGDTLKGCITIGWGTNLSAGIPVKLAQILFNHSVDEARKDASTVIGYGIFSALSQARQDALTEMAYQMGRTRLSGFKDMIEAVKEGNWDRAAAEAHDSAWARDFPDRANRVVSGFLEGF